MQKASNKMDTPVDETTMNLILTATARLKDIVDGVAR
jgi:hypothetical protein